jgi:hypothetical protein
VATKELTIGFQNLLDSLLVPVTDMEYALVYLLQVGIHLDEVSVLQDALVNGQSDFRSRSRQFGLTAHARAVGFRHQDILFQELPFIVHNSLNIKAHPSIHQRTL